MDIKHEIVGRVPTAKSKQAIWFLLLGTPALCALAAFLNPITLELDSRQLTWLQIYIALTMVFVTSIYLNFHMHLKLKEIGKFIDDGLPLLAAKIAEHEINEYKSQHESVNKKP